MTIARRVIDWKATGLKLKLLRCDNITLRRNVCRELSMTMAKGHICKTLDCDNCTNMDNQISQAELAIVMSVSDSMVANWETNRTIPTLEDLLMYYDLTGISLKDIIVFE